MSNGRRRVPARQYLRRGSMSRTYKRRRFIRPGRRLPAYNRSTRYLARPLGNPLAITERKYHDVERGAAMVNFASPDWSVCSLDPINTLLIPTTLNTFNAIPVGTSWQQRIGRKVQIISLKIKGEVGVGASGTDLASGSVAQTIRVVIFIDTQTNGAYPYSPNGVMYSGPTSNMPANYFQDGNGFGRYKILQDYRFVLNPTTLAYNYTTNTQLYSACVRLIDYTHVFRPPLTVHYNSANTSTNQDIIDNSIHLAITKDSNTLPNVFCNYKARLTFFDC